MIELIIKLSWFIWMVYVISGNMIYGRCRDHQSPLARRLWQWTKWPALAGCVTPVFDWFTTGEPPTMSGWASTFVSLIVWWALRNAGGDDDDFRRWLLRQTERVKESAGRLVVVPATA